LSVIESILIWLLHRCSRLLRRRDIMREDGQLYLSRYRVFGWMPGDTRSYPFSIYLHRFHTPDYDPAPHNHPWKWARSLILTGGYVECIERRTGTSTGTSGLVERRPWTVNQISADTFHVVEELRGRETWTLFLAGPKTSAWGFWVAGRGYVPWRERLIERGLTPEY